MPAVWLAVLSVVVDGGVTTRPPVNEPGSVTARVLVPVSAVTGFTVILTAAPGPVWVLQLKLIAVELRVSLFVACNAPEPRAITANATGNLLERTRCI